MSVLAPKGLPVDEGEERVMTRLRRNLALARTNLQQELAQRRAHARFRQGDWRFLLEKASNYCVGIVLSYHRVNRFPKEEFCPTRGLAVHTDDFEAHLAFLKQHFSIIPLTQLMECLRSGVTLPENFVVLSFDDGYEDNYTDAFPLLEKYQAPATIFVTVGLVGRSDLLWHDWLEVLLGRTERTAVSWPGEPVLRLPLRSVGERWYAYEWMSQRLARLPADQRADVLLNLGRALGEASAPETDPQRRLL